MSDTQTFYVDYDENGNEVKTVKGKGRTKLGYVKGEDGNYYVDKNFDREAHIEQQRAKYQTTHYYIVQDENGNELSRKVAGRGKPPKKYAKGEDGNFYLTVTEETSTQEASVEDLNPTQETVGNETVV